MRRKRGIVSCQTIRKSNADSSRLLKDSPSEDWGEHGGREKNSSSVGIVGETGAELQMKAVAAVFSGNAISPSRRRLRGKCEPIGVDGGRRTRRGMVWGKERARREDLAKTAELPLDTFCLGFFWPARFLRWELLSPGSIERLFRQSSVR